MERRSLLGRLYGGQVRFLAFAVALLAACRSVYRPSAPERDLQHWQLVRGWPGLAPGVKLGQVSGVGVDTLGLVMVFHRAGGTFDREATKPRPTATVFELDAASGALINSWGADRFVLPHSLTVDRQNNVWLTDDILHQAMKFSHDGELLLAVGTRRVSGWDSTHFNEPTDVAIAADGSFYVSDGYQNSRVAYFRNDGHFVKEWGTKGRGEGQFDIPHGLALDSEGNVYVADRENRRVQVFDKSGVLRRVWPTSDSTGRVFDVAVTARGFIYLAIRNQGGTAEVRIMNRGWGEVARIVADSTILLVPHQIAVQGDSVLYIADTNGERILKYIRR